MREKEHLIPRKRSSSPFRCSREHQRIWAIADKPPQNWKGSLFTCPKTDQCSNLRLAALVSSWESNNSVKSLVCAWLPASSSLVIWSVLSFPRGHVSLNSIHLWKLILSVRCLCTGPHTLHNRLLVPCKKSYLYLMLSVRHEKLAGYSNQKELGVTNLPSPSSGSPLQSSCAFHMHRNQHHFKESPRCK